MATLVWSQPARLPLDVRLEVERAEREYVAWWLREVAEPESAVAIADRNAPVFTGCVDTGINRCLSRHACWDEGYCIEAYDTWSTRPHLWEGDYS